MSWFQVSEETELVEAEESDLDEEANLRFYNAMAEKQKLKRKKIEMENQDGWVHFTTFSSCGLS